LCCIINNKLHRDARAFQADHAIIPSGEADERRDAVAELYLRLARSFSLSKRDGGITKNEAEKVCEMLNLQLRKWTKPRPEKKRKTKESGGSRGPSPLGSRGPSPLALGLGGVVPSPAVLAYYQPATTSLAQAPRLPPPPPPPPPPHPTAAAGLSLGLLQGIEAEDARVVASSVSASDPSLTSSLATPSMGSAAATSAAATTTTTTTTTTTVLSAAASTAVAGSASAAARVPSPTSTAAPAVAVAAAPTAKAEAAAAKIAVRERRERGKIAKEILDEAKARYDGPMVEQMKVSVYYLFNYRL